MKKNQKKFSSAIAGSLIAFLLTPEAKSIPVGRNPPGNGSPPQHEPGPPSQDHPPDDPEESIPLNPKAGWGIVLGSLFLLSRKANDL